MKLSTENLNAVAEALKDTYQILGELLNSAQLDSSTEAEDCLQVFQDYEWALKPGCDKSKFSELKEKGNAGTMTEQELQEFMGMVSKDGQAHIYFSIYQGREAIRKYNKLISSQ